MQMIRSYKDLVVWQKSVDLSILVYALTKHFPAHERFGLSSQMQRAAVSVAANIAEGHGRGTRNDYAHFLDIAHGSITELGTLLTIARKLSYCPEELYSTIDGQILEIGRMLGVLRAKIRPRP